MIKKLFKKVNSIIEIFNQLKNNKYQKTEQYIVCAVIDDAVGFYVDDNSYTYEFNDAYVFTSLDDASYVATERSAMKALTTFITTFGGREIMKLSQLNHQDLKYLRRITSKATHWIEKIDDLKEFNKNNEIIIN